MSCQPSSLISAIHRNLPYFTNNPFQGVNLSNATFTIENILADVERAGVWSAIILGVLLLFMICTCTYCCCSCVFCCRGNKKPTVLKVLLGLVTAAVIFISICIVFVGFWAETSLHNGLVSQILSVGTFIGNFTDSPETSSTIDDLVVIVEDRRHLAFIIYLVILLVFLIVVFVVAILAPVCNSGIGVIVVVIILGIETVLIHAPISVFMFGVLVIYSDVCVGLYSILCDAFSLGNSGEFSVWLKTLDVFCNSAVQSGFILFALGLALTLFFIIVQIFGMAYGLSFFGRDSGSFSPNDPVSMRGTNIWGNSDEVAEESSVYPTTVNSNRKVDDDKIVLVQMTDMGNEDRY